MVARLHSEISAIQSDGTAEGEAGREMNENRTDFLECAILLNNKCRE